MKTARIAVLLAAIGLSAVTACGSEPSDSATQAGTPTGDSAGTPTEREPTAAAPVEEDVMRVAITVGDQRLPATLADSAASRDLLAQLPQTVEMTDHGGVEKTGPLRASLSLEGQPSGADPGVGDLGYYAPGNDLVLYYGDQSYFPGIVVLGKLEGDAAQRIAELAGRVTVTVEAA